MKAKQRLAAFVMMAASAALAQVPMQPGWTEYESQAGGFRISIPGPPNESKAARPLRSVTVNSLSKEELFACYVTVTFYPVSLQPKANAGAYLDSIYKDYAGRKLGQTELEIQGLPARRSEWMVEKAGVEMKQSALDIFTGNRIFNLKFTYGPKDHSEAAERFFKSFHITDARYVSPGELIEFRPEGWNFSVKMPGFPEQMEQNGANGKSVSLSNYAFFVTVGEVHPIPEDAEKFLANKGAQMGALYHGKVVSSEPVAGASARRMLIVGDNSKTDVVFGIKGSRYYVMSVNTKPDGNLGKDLVNGFFSSMVLN